MKSDRLIISLLLLPVIFACTGQQQTSKADNPPSGNSDKIEVYYFHFTARCETCRTIEARAKENLDLLYPNLVGQGLITFHALNLDEEPNRSLAEKLGVTGQTLLLVKGDQKINITNEGFLYAVAKPEKFKEVINQKVADLLIR